MSLTRCQCCGSTFQDSGRHSRHLGLKPACQKFYNNLADERAQQKVADDLPHVVVDQPATCLLDELDIGDVPVDPTGSALLENDSTRGCAGMPVAQKLRRVIIEEVEDEEGGIAEPWTAETFPTPVAVDLGKGTTHFEDLRAEQEGQGLPAEAPFEDGEEWGLAKWLLRQATQTGIDEFLKLPIVSEGYLCITSLALTLKHCRLVTGRSQPSRTRKRSSRKSMHCRSDRDGYVMC